MEINFTEVLFVYPDQDLLETRVGLQIILPRTITSNYDDSISGKTQEFDFPLQFTNYR